MQTEYKTSNFYMAAFLIYKGEVLVGMTGDQRKEFVFATKNDALVNAFQVAPHNSPDVMVDPRLFMSIIRSLKAKIYDEGIHS